MAKITFNQPDEEMIADFFLDFSEAYQSAERLLLELEKAPHDTHRLNELFRQVHTIRGNLTYIGLDDIGPLLQSVEDVLEPLRKGKLQYDDLLSDVILLAMDATYSLVDASLHNKPRQLSIAQMQKICLLISNITEVDETGRANAISQAILALDPSAQHSSEQPPELITEYGIESDPDLALFRALQPAIAQRSPYWHERSQRIAKLALAMNRKAGEPESAQQLLAAVYMHDFAMAFLPLELLHKPGRLSASERNLVRQHCTTSAALLHSMGNWSAAAKMVLQHHEQPEGTGYPNQLKEAQICEGAKILAIADAFDACVNSRAHVDQPQRPLIRAVLEINRHAGSQFCQHWVDIFNQVARPERSIETSTK